MGIVFVQSTSKYGIFIYPTCSDQRLCVCPSTINILELNQFLLSSNFGGFHFLSWNSQSNAHWRKKHNKICVVWICEHVSSNLNPTWFTSKYTMFTLFQHKLCIIWKDELFKNYGVQKKIHVHVNQIKKEN